MLKISFVEIILRGIPEGLLFILAGYAFSKYTIQVKRYLISSMLYSVIVYSIRYLPIEYGANTILNLIVIIILLISINKIDIIKAIKSGILVMLLGFISEGVNMFILQVILKKEINLIFNNNLLKILYGIPSSLIFACVAVTYYLILLKRKELKSISYGKDN